MNTAKDKFLEMYHNLPEKARDKLVYNPFIRPMTLNVCYFEIRENTKLGKEILKDLGYETT